MDCYLTGYGLVGSKIQHPTLCFLPACGLVKPPSFQETFIGGLITFAGTLCFIEGLVSWTRLAANALTGLFIEDMVQGAGGSRQSLANALAGI